MLTAVGYPLPFQPDLRPRSGAGSPLAASRSHSVGYPRLPAGEWRAAAGPRLTVHRGRLGADQAGRAGR